MNPHIYNVYPDISNRLIRAHSEMEKLHKVQMLPCMGIRTVAQQNALYAIGRTKPGRLVSAKAPMGSVVTNAKGFESYHNFGAAIDSCFAGKDPFLEQMDKKKAAFLWSEFGRLAELEGLRWGGKFKGLSDRPHIELSYGYNLRQLEAIYKEGGLLAIWKKFDAASGNSFAVNPSPVHNLLISSI